MKSYARLYVYVSMGIIIPLLGIVAVFSGMVHTPVAYAAACTGSDVSGTVYRDYNADGAIGALEPGVFNTTVTAYGQNGTVVDTCETDANGAYGLSIGANYPVRVEISGYASTLEPAPVGADNDSTVTFVTANATGIDFGLNAPPDYCQNNPDLVTNCYIYGPQTSGTFSNNVALVSFPYESGTTSTSDNTGVEIPTTHALAVPAREVGTTFGLAYNRDSGFIYVAALTKRHAGYGPDGVGAIYQVDATTGAVSLFLDLNATAFSAGADYHDSSNWDADATVWDAVGKTAFGDLDISADGNTLWAINQNDRRLFEIDINTASVTAAITLPDPADCTFDGSYTPPANAVPIPAAVVNPDVVPGGLKVVGDTVYVGMVCSAESTNDPTDLRGYVYDYTGGSFTQVANFSLNYDRYQEILDVPPCGGEPVVPSCHYQWQPWSASVISITSPFNGRHYPQAWLTDIEFDENNFMILGFADRFGHQSGNINNSVGTTEGRQHGDTLRLEPSSGTWILENNGVSGGIPGSGVGNQHGPGGGEFYGADYYSGSASEITSGGLAAELGLGEIIIGAIDPHPVKINTPPNFRNGGVIWLDNSDGSRARSYQLYAIDEPATFGKAAGIGDLELICQQAPIEIGNRVWYDLNGDGVQDPGEPGILGIALGLYDAGGNLIVTTVTNGNGDYYFNDANVPGGLTPMTTYTVGVLDINFTASGVLENYTMAPADQNPDSLATPDVRDSDGVAVSVGSGANVSTRGVTLTTGSAGANNHTYDFAFFAMDLGDLPDTGAGSGAGNYQTQLSDAGAAHIVYPDTDKNGVPDLTGAIWLGTIVDPETDGNQDPVAAGDDNSNTDDEDGVVRNGNWSDGAGGGPISVTVDGVTCAANGWLVAWFDFDGDGVFDTLLNQSIFNCTTTNLGVNVPGGTFGSGLVTVHARFRVFDSQAEAEAVAGGTIDLNNGFTGTASNGEVEDYVWTFGPTAVGLQNVDITPIANNWLWLALFLFIAATSGWLWRGRRLNRG